MYEQSPDRDQINRPIDELHYEPVNPRFRSVQIVSAVIAYSLLAVLALLLLLVDTYWWCIAAEIVITVSSILKYSGKHINLRDMHSASMTSHIAEE